MILMVRRIQNASDRGAGVLDSLRELGAGMRDVLERVIQYSFEHPLVIAVVVALIGVVALRPRHTPR